MDKFYILIGLLISKCVGPVRAVWQEGHCVVELIFIDVFCVKEWCGAKWAWQTKDCAHKNIIVVAIINDAITSSPYSFAFYFRDVYIFVY